jgi:NADPH:quinone reductase-like Zn-dependent oxidoreductase
VAAVGSSATGFQVGDEVFGTVPLGGAYAQYLVVRPSNSRTAIAHKPKGISHEHAGVIPSRSGKPLTWSTSVRRTRPARRELRSERLLWWFTETMIW